MRKILPAVTILLLLSSVLCDDFTRKREEMVEKQIISRGITDPETLHAMLTVQRHLFVPEDLQDEAYADYALPIGYGQTISQPYVVALMTSSLGLQGNETVLEIGTGSGYQAAVLAEISGHVYTIEIIPELAQSAEKTLQELEYTNVTVKNADGYFGWEEHHPYDAIMITAAVDHIPSPLIQQLKEGGRLVLPLGNPLYYQALTLVEKKDSELYTKHICDVSFVPMTGYALEMEKGEQEKEQEQGSRKEQGKGKEKEEETVEGSESEGKDLKKEILYTGVVLGVLLILVVVWKVRMQKRSRK